MTTALASSPAVTGKQHPIAEPSIAEVLKLLYDVISFEDGAEPDFQGLKRLFSPHARITRITPESTDHLTPSDFLEMTHHLVEIGAYTGFYEFEVARNVEQFGDVAQVWSVYETRRNRDAQEALGRGINSIQLIREGGTWRVLSLLWDEAAAEHPSRCGTPEGVEGWTHAESLASFNHIHVGGISNGQV